MSIRPVKRILESQPTTEGAGVKLRRAFGFGDTSEFDPFLLFDDFRNDNPEDFLAGFPWHPHRGIETITYVLCGHRHARRQSRQPGRSRRRRRAVDDRRPRHPSPGDAEGRRAGRMHGFQLWANLPASLKMTKPRYQDVVARDIPETVDDDGTAVRVICGTFWGQTGPVEGVAADPRYLDISVPPGRRKRLAVETSRHAFAYVFAGSGTFRDASAPRGVDTELVGSTGARAARRHVACRSAGGRQIAAAARLESATLR